MRASPTGWTASSNSNGEGGQKESSAPGRARHKPSDHRAGKAVCWASPVCCWAVLPACAFRAADRGCRRHPAFPAPSWLRGRRDQAKLGRIKPREREGVSARHKLGHRRLGKAQACLRGTPNSRVHATHGAVVSRGEVRPIARMARTHPPGLVDVTCPEIAGFSPGSRSVRGRDAPRSSGGRGYVRNWCTAVRFPRARPARDRAGT